MTETWTCAGCAALQNEMMEIRNLSRKMFKVAGGTDERDKARLDWIQSGCEEIALEDWSDDVQEGRAWRINDDTMQTDNLRDAIDAAMGRSEGRGVDE